MLHYMDSYKIPQNKTTPGFFKKGNLLITLRVLKKDSLKIL